MRESQRGKKEREKVKEMEGERGKEGVESGWEEMGKRELERERERQRWESERERERKRQKERERERDKRRERK